MDLNSINSIAREIVSNLDKKDGKEDGKIEASIWNKFVCEKQGKEIHNYINTNNAIKSVITYLKREVAKTGQAIGDVANEWLKNVGGGDKTEIEENPKTKSDNNLTVNPIILNDFDEGIDDTKKAILQNTVDEAAQLLMDVANGKYRYKKYDIDDKGMGVIELNDGRYISFGAEKQENGKWKIDNIDIASYNAKDGCYNLEIINSSNQNLQRIMVKRDIDGENYYANAEFNQETCQSYFKLIQQIYGDEVEV